MVLQQLIGPSAVSDLPQPRIALDMLLHLPQASPPANDAANHGREWIVEDSRRHALAPPPSSIGRSADEAVQDLGSVTSVRDVLAAWRAAERAIGAAAIGSSEWATIQLSIGVLRARYHELFDARYERRAPMDETRLTDLRRYVTGVGRNRS